MKRNNIFTLLISSLISIVFCEIFLRAFNLGYNSGALNTSSFAHHENPYNYKLNSYSPDGEFKNIIINFDEYGHRIVNKNCTNIFSQDNPQIIFLGDSYVAGHQVSDNNSFPNIIQNKLCDEELIVHNFGIASYSPVLSYLHLIRQINNNKKLNLKKGSHIIHVLFDNDIEDDRKYSKLIKYKRSDNGLIPVINTKSKYDFIKSNLRRSYLIRLIRRFQITLKTHQKRKEVFQNNNDNRSFNSDNACQIPEKDIEITELYLKKLNTYILSHGFKYSLTAVPSPPRSLIKKTNYSCFKNISKKINISFIDFPEEIFNEPSKYYFAKDIHLNALGNKVLAKKIHSYLLKGNYK